MRPRLVRSNFFLLLAIALGLTVSSCSFFSGAPDKGIKSKTLKINFKKDGWSSTKADLADYAFKHGPSKSFLLVNSLCQKYDRTSLEQLTDNLLAGLQDSDILEQHERRLFGRASLRTHAVGSLDGVQTAMLIEVVKRDRCIYDFVLISQGNKVAEPIKRDFDVLLANTKVE